MKWNDGGNGGNFAQPEAGSYAARCYRVIDLGTQTSEYQGKTTTKRQCVIGWELSELMDDGRPFTVSKFYTSSLNEKATLRKDLEAWRGRAFTDDELAGFDAKNVIGATCLVSLAPGQTGKLKVTTVTKLPKGMVAPEPVNEPLIFDLDDYNEAAFALVGKGLQAIIAKSPEYMMLTQGAPRAAATLNVEEDIPF